MGTVFVDFDGTIFDERESLKAASKEILGKELEKEEIRKLPKEIKSKIYETNITKYYNLYKPIEKTIEIIKEYKNRGYKIIILSARSSKYKDILKKLLDMYSIPYDDIICRDNMEIKDEVWKAEIIKNLKDDDIVVIEDKEENLEYIERVVGNIKKILIK